MPKIHDDISRALNIATTALANDQLEGVRREFIAAVSWIDTAIGGSSLSDEGCAMIQAVDVPRPAVTPAPAIGTAPATAKPKAIVPPKMPDGDAPVAEMRGFCIDNEISIPSGTRKREALYNLIVEAMRTRYGG